MKSNKYKIFFYVSALISIALLTRLMFKHWNNNDLLSLLLIGLSNIILFISFIFGDSLNKKDENGKSKLTEFGYYFAILLLCSTVINLLSTNANIVEREVAETTNSIKTDTIIANSKATIQKLEAQADTARIQISSLTKKIDSLKDSQIEIAAKEFNEFLKRIEAEKENTFIHFRAEVTNNLRKLYASYDTKRLDSLLNTTSFFNGAMSNEYTKKYYQISSNENNLKEIGNLLFQIEEVNDLTQMVYKTRGHSREGNMIGLKESVLHLHRQLYFELNYLYGKTSYKQYEGVDRKMDFTRFDHLELEYILGFKLTPNMKKMYDELINSIYHKRRKAVKAKS